MNQSKPLHAAPQARRGVRPVAAALKTLAVLDLLGKASRPLRLAEITRAAGESRATTYQKLLTLVEAGWAEQDAEGAYRLSLHAARVGEAALRQANLGERSRLVMEALVAEVGETVSLAVIHGVQAQLVQRVETQAAVRVQNAVGMLLSLDQSASGRALTAFVSAETREVLRKKGAVLASDALLREVKRAGYAVSSGRDVPGVRSVAVPVFHATAGVSALSVVAPLSRFEEARYVKPLLRAAAQLTASGADA
jgi:DNA-binding IclR family transcriptional regulator